MKQIVTIIIVLTISSCGQKRSLNYADIIGKYYNGPDRTNYHDLLLRDDSTYIGHMSYKWGDNMFEFAGQWRITDDTIILFKGNEFTDQLEIKYPNDINSDSLSVNINELLKYDKNIRLSLNDTDFKIKDGKIKIYKPDYWKDEHFKNDNGFLPGNIDFRLKNAFARIQYFNTDKDMDISLAANSTINQSIDTVLCKYFFKDSILYSIKEHWTIERHNLKKEK